MHNFLNSPWQLGACHLPHRLIQGPLAGYSCAPFRQLFYRFTPPAYCVSEMLSAYDVVHKHAPTGRYLYRAAEETTLCYQLGGSDPMLMAEAAAKLDHMGADLIDLNCGCPKTKIRKHGAGSALLEQPQRLQAIIAAVRQTIRCPLTVKIRLQGNDNDLTLATMIAQEGADALIVHGRRWVDDYDVPCDLNQIARIKQAVSLPVIVNGDIRDYASLSQAFERSGCDAFMISRAGTGKPWLYKQLLTNSNEAVPLALIQQQFIDHLRGLAALENEYQAVLQSKSLVKYYFRDYINTEFLQKYYGLTSIAEIEDYSTILRPPSTLTT